jgi:serine/threonine protein kinase
MSTHLLLYIHTTTNALILSVQPERIRGEKYDIRADVWSAGLSILEFAQSRYPYTNSGSEIELMIQITNGEVRCLFPLIILIICFILLYLIYHTPSALPLYSLLGYAIKTV